MALTLIECSANSERTFTFMAVHDGLVDVAKFLIGNNEFWLME